MTIGIYKITNKNTGEVYIGQSQNCERRIGEHKKERFQTIDNYINVLGKENFDFEIIEECLNQEELDLKEQEYIKQYDSQKNGYNKQRGGYNNSIGEGNGRAIVTEEDVIKIRQAYNNHENASKYFHDYIEPRGLTKSQFQSIWQGVSWSHIMPEVFTEENKHYYIHEAGVSKCSLTKEEILRYREYYVNHTRDEVYDLLIKEHGDNFLKRRTFERIIIGDVRENSDYLKVPVYKKVKRCWELNGKPVSTISESGK